MIRYDYDIRAWVYEHGARRLVFGSKGEADAYDQDVTERLSNGFVECQGEDYEGIEYNQITKENEND